MRPQLQETSGNTSVSKPPFDKFADSIYEVRSDGQAAMWTPSTNMTKPDTARKKRWHHKTRTGCFTCRRRRVKCDEQRPSCLRCCKVNEKCHYERQGSAQQPILIRYQPSGMPSASDKLDLGFLQFFIENTKLALSITHLSSADRRSVMSLDIDKAIERFWEALGLPLVHFEPLIFQLIVLLGRKHRVLLETSKASDEDFLQVINVMSKIIKTRSQDIVVVGSCLASAFQVLHSIHTGDCSGSVKGDIHATAFSKMLLNSSDAVFEYIKPLTDFTWRTLSTCATSQHQRSLEIPDEFLDFEDAQYHFAETMKLHLSKLRPALEKWLRAMSKLYERVRGKDWEHSKTVLTLFIYGRHMLLHSDVILAVGHDIDVVWERVEERAQSMSLPLVPVMA